VKGSNDTTVSAGVLPGAGMTIVWWAVSVIFGVEAPDGVVAASVMIVTALVQRYSTPQKYD